MLAGSAGDRGLFPVPLARSHEGPDVGSSFGKVFRITTFGESHGGAVGVVVDGCPPRLALDVAEIQADLDRRRPGQSSIVTPRKEADLSLIHISEPTRPLYLS